MSEVPKRRTAHKPGIGRPRGMPPSQMAGKNFCLHGDTNATLTPPLLSTPVLSSPFQLISCHHSSSLCTFLPSFSHIFCVQTYSWNGHRPPPPPPTSSTRSSQTVFHSPNSCSSLPAAAFYKSCFYPCIKVRSLTLFPPSSPPPTFSFQKTTVTEAWLSGGANVGNHLQPCHCNLFIIMGPRTASILRINPPPALHYTSPSHSRWIVKATECLSDLSVLGDISVQLRPHLFGVSAE